MEELHAVCVDGPLAVRRFRVRPILPGNLSPERFATLDGHRYVIAPSSRYPTESTVHEFIYLPAKP